MKNKQPKLSFVVAMGKRRVIGYQNRLPWHLPADLRRFKQLTLNKPVLMGRHTYLSIGKALPHRSNLVVSRRTDFQPKDCRVFSSIEQALVSIADADEVMVIGGAKLYEQLLPQADRLFLTLIQHEFPGDAFFPDWQRYQWREVERIECAADSNNPYPYIFLTLQRLRM